MTADELRKYKERYPDAAVVLYVNTLAEAKAEADILCTSANAVKIVESLDARKNTFWPRLNLEWFVSHQVKDKEIIPAPERGHCYVHKMFNLGDLYFLRERIS